MNDPTVSQYNGLDMQVCVPQGWIDAQVVSLC